MNQPPTASFTVSATSGPAPLAVSFDATSSTDDGTIVAYQWNFEAGMASVGPVGAPMPTSAEKTPAWTYRTPGTHTAVLRVQDNQGKWSEWTSKTVTVAAPVNQPPSANFTVSASSGPAPLAVSFDATPSTDDGTIVAYQWNFEAGMASVGPVGAPMPTSSNKTPNWTYTTPGTHTAVLRVQDNQGKWSEWTSKTITVADGYVPPTAVLQLLTTNNRAGYGVKLDASASTIDGNFAWFSWNFGDGEERFDTSFPRYIKNYKAPGKYKVTVKVKDDRGNVGTAVQTVTVLPNPAPVASFTATPVQARTGAPSPLTQPHQRMTTPSITTGPLATERLRADIIQVRPGPLVSCRRAASARQSCARSTRLPASIPSP